jgi:hypothetical protein
MMRKAQVVVNSLGVDEGGHFTGSTSRSTESTGPALCVKLQASNGPLQGISQDEDDPLQGAVSPSTMSQITTVSRGSISCNGLQSKGQYPRESTRMYPPDLGGIAQLAEKLQRQPVSTPRLLQDVELESKRQAFERLITSRDSEYFDDPDESELKKNQSPSKPRRDCDVNTLPGFLDTKVGKLTDQAVSTPRLLEDIAVESKQQALERLLTSRQKSRPHAQMGTDLAANTVGQKKVQKRMTPSDTLVRTLSSGLDKTVVFEPQVKDDHQRAELSHYHFLQHYLEDVKNDLKTLWQATGNQNRADQRSRRRGGNKSLRGTTSRWSY